MRVSKEPAHLKLLTISLSGKQRTVFFQGPGDGLLTSLPPASSSASPSSLPPHQWPLRCQWALLTIQKNRDGDHLIDCHWLNYCSLGGLSRGIGSFLGRSLPVSFHALPSLVHGRASSNVAGLPPLGSLRIALRHTICLAFLGTSDGFQGIFSFPSFQNHRSCATPISSLGFAAQLLEASQPSSHNAKMTPSSRPSHQQTYWGDSGLFCQLC